MKTTIQGLLLSVIAALAFLCGQQMMAAEISVTKQYDVSINAGTYTVHDIATEITKQIGVAFSYGNKLSNTKISVPDVDMHDATLDVILNAVFKQAGMKWVIKENMIALYVEEEEQPLAVKDDQSSARFVSGTVMDIQQQPLVGVVVYVRKDAKRASVSDLDGKFTLQANPGDELVFSLVGYEEETYKVAGPVSGLRVMLREDIQQLEETVVVAYGSQKKSNLIGSVAQVNSNELKTAPATNLTAMLAGKLPGLVSRQSSGQPGADGANLYIRGVGAGDGQMLVVVDGVIRSMSDISPEEIESISILKDATAAAAYGVRASSGVMLITTKSGKVQKPTIDFNSSVSLSSNTTFPEFLDGPGYAYWYNKSQELDGVPESGRRFTPEEIERITNGDPEGIYANTDWFKLLFKPFAPTYNNSVSLSGGSENFKYYVMAGAYNQEGIIDRTSYDRYNVRANIDAKIIDNLSVKVGFAYSNSTQMEPGLSAGKGNTWASILSQAVMMYPYLPTEYDGLPVGSMNGAGNGNQNPLAARDNSGASVNKRNTTNLNAALKYDFPFVKGLSFKLNASYDQTNSFSKISQLAYKLNVWNQATKTFNVENARHLSDGQSQVNQWQYEYNSYTIQPSVEYAGSFGKHHVSALLLYDYSRNDSRNMSSGMRGYKITDVMEINFGEEIIPSLIKGGYGLDRRAGYVSRFNYDYDERFLVEVTMRYDGTPYLPEEYRWGLFPGVALGWKLSTEPYIKLRASAGRLGSDRSLGYSYSYLSTMGMGSDPVVMLGTTPSYYINPSAPVNTSLRWQTTDTYNLGVDTKFWNGLLAAELDMFYMYTKDKMEAQSGTYPPSMGNYYPSYVNYGEHDNKGFELVLTHANKVNEFNYQIRGNLSWARNKILKVTEDANQPDYMKKTGTSIGQYYGFKSNGLFQTEEEIRTSPTYGKNTTKPGDIRLVDMNRDGQITWAQDRTVIGRSSTPEMIFGLNFNAFWRDFDFNIFFQGAALCDIPLCGCYTDRDGIYDDTPYTRPFAFDGNTPRYLVENSWTPEKTDAKYPRLRIESAANGGKMSDWWFVDGSYIRLKSVQLGYSLPRKVLTKLGLQRCRFYVSGGNLFTISALPYLDPEMPDVNQGYYPQQRNVEFGINISL